MHCFLVSGLAWGLAYGHGVQRRSTEETDGFKKQWYLHNTEDEDFDLHVQGFWHAGFTGQGVTVAIVDDGVNHKHADLIDNFDMANSANFISMKKDPYPAEEENTHGSPCAGIVAAKRTGKCGSGVAYGAKVTGVRLFDKNQYMGHSNHALNYNNQVNDIYSCSWGAGRSESEIDSLHSLDAKALANGTETGRGGKGSIFVFASGNSAQYSDNCAFDGFVNSIHTIAVGAVNKEGEHIKYSEACSAVLITAYSSDPDSPDIHTTGHRDNNCRADFTGTSAATPMVSGVVALVLSKSPNLTWRDIQHLLIQTARQTDECHKSWRRTYAGRYFSNHHGYGVVDGARLLKTLQNYKPVGDQITIHSQPFKKDAQLPNNKDVFRDQFHVTRELLQDNARMVLEHVVVTLTIKSQKRSNIRVTLVSPNTVMSEIVTPRRMDDSSDGFNSHAVLSLAFWDEPVAGIWELIVHNNSPTESPLDQLVEWKVTFYGRDPNTKKVTTTTTTPAPKTLEPITINFKEEL